MKKIVYVAAPLDPTKEEVDAYLAANPMSRRDAFEICRSGNLERASRWVAWIVEGGFIPVATWIVLARMWQSEWLESKRDVGMMMDVELVYRSDELWLVGGRISDRMTIERRAAEFSSIRVRDLTRLGPEPPTDKPTAEIIK